MLVVKAKRSGRSDLGPLSAFQRSRRVLCPDPSRSILVVGYPVAVFPWIRIGQDKDDLVTRRIPVPIGVAVLGEIRIYVFGWNHSQQGPIEWTSADTGRAKDCLILRTVPKKIGLSLDRAETLIGNEREKSIDGRSRIVPLQIMSCRDSDWSTGFDEDIVRPYPPGRKPVRLQGDARRALMAALDEVRDEWNRAHANIQRALAYGSQ